MSYYLYDANGYVGDLASTLGWSQLSSHLEAAGGPLAKTLVAEGSVDNPGALLAELGRVPPPTDPTVLSTLQNMIELLKRSEVVAIVTDGVFGDEGGAEPT